MAAPLTALSRPRLWGRLPRLTPPPVAWVVWAAAAAHLSLAVVRYGSKLPAADDLWLVPYVTGAKPVTLGWLWEAFYQHRMPVPKLLLVALTAPAQSFLPAKVLNVLLLAAGAALVLAVRPAGVRADARFVAVPLAFLSVSQFEVISTAHALNLVLGAVLMVAVVVLIARRPRPDSPGAVAALGLALVALPPCGMVGMAFVPAAAVWLGAAAAADRRLRRSPVVWATLAALAVEGALYVRGLDLPPQPAEPTADKVARLAGHTAKLFSLSPGWTSPETWWSSAALMAGPALAAVTMCVHAAARRPGERVRAAGLLAWLGGWLVLLAGVAWGRSGWRDLFLSRYVTLAVPLNAWVVLVAVLYGGRRWGWGVPLWLVAVQLYVYPGGIAIGRHCGVTHRQLMKEFEHDAKAGTPIPVLAERYADGLLFGQRAALCERLLELRAAGWRPFAGLPDDPYDAHDLPARDGEHVWLPGSAEVVAVRFAYHAPGGTAGELRVDTPAGPPPRPTRLSDRPGDHTAIVFLNRQTDNLGWQLTPTGHRVGQVTVIVPRGAWPGGRPWPE